MTKTGVATYTYTPEDLEEIVPYYLIHCLGVNEEKYTLRKWNKLIKDTLVEKRFLSNKRFMKDARRMLEQS